MQIRINYAEETRFTVKPDKELQSLKNCQDSNAALFNTTRLQLIFIKEVFFSPCLNSVLRIQVSL